jgi:hypothetical protein
MLKKDLFKLQYILDKCKDRKGIKFAYMVLKNLKKVEAEIALIRELDKPIEGIQEFENKRVDLVKQFAEKDEKGEYVVVKDKNGAPNYKVEGEALANYKIEYAKLEEEYKDALQKRIDLEIGIENIVNEEIELNLHKIELEAFPEDLDANELEVLQICIKD